MATTTLHSFPPRADAALAALPKAHLHLHLVGAMRRSTFAELLGPLGTVQFPSPPRYTHRQFARMYDLATALVRTAADLERLIDEVVADQAADGVWWVELTADPLLYKGRLGSPADVVDMFVEMGAAAARRHGVGVGWVLCANRASAPGARHVADLAADAAERGVVGFGLAGDEMRSSPGSFTSAFACAREAGLILCPHAGELRGPADVAAALQRLQPDRLGHALGAASDAEVLAHLADRQILVEACPASNVSLWLVPSLRRHPLPLFVGAGVPVALSTDDPLLFGDTLTDLYAAVAGAFRFGRPEMAALALSSFRHSGAPLTIRRRAEQAIRAWLASQPVTERLSA